MKNFILGTDGMPIAAVNELIYVSIFLEYSRSAGILLENRRKLARGKRQGSGTRLLLSALWDGYWELSNASKDALGKAIQRGQLLYAWEGTQALRGQEGDAA